MQVTQREKGGTASRTWKNLAEYPNLGFVEGCRQILRHVSTAMLDIRTAAVLSHGKSIPARSADGWGRGNGTDINGWDSQGIKAGRSSENIRGRLSLWHFLKLVIGVRKGVWKHNNHPNSHAIRVIGYFLLVNLPHQTRADSKKRPHFVLPKQSQELRHHLPSLLVSRSLFQST